MKKSLALASIVILSGCAEQNYPVSFTYTPEQKPVYAKSAVAQNYPSSRPADSEFRNPGNPERLIDTSSELVSMSLASRGALNELSRMIMQDPPTRAELNCSRSEALCSEARSMLASHGVPAEFKGMGDGVTLVYERVMARDCDSRFIDNSSNPYNKHHPAFGCSVVANTVQMVSDKRQFINPALTDYQDGDKAVQTYRRYESAPPEVPETSRSFLRSITTQ